MKDHDGGVAAALAVTLFAWGLSYVWTKVALTAMGPFTLVCLRFTLATALFGLLFLVTGRRPQRLGRADRWRMFFLALLQPVGHFAFETCGLVYTTASAAALIVAAIPLAVLALAVCLGRQRAGTGDVARIVVSAGGVALIILGGGQGGQPAGGELAGNLLMVGAVVSTAGYVVLGGALVRRLDAWTVTFAQLACGAALFVPGCVWEIAARGWPAPDSRQLAALAALTVLASLAAFLCYNYVLSRLSPARSALWLNAVPVVTAVGAWASLGERLGWWQLVGGAAVVMSVAVPGWHRPRRLPQRPGRPLRSARP
ncbi:protein of unknown function DUF6 transmembrane [Solidesulfovibrio fructosivorans JJ]]|uniref:EamA domain-containing protein n=1 Tax=Solidesulfovibrio fructosivorans JJ] TaxID=596151 RepID=E1JUK4_SOLFR|nr:DMT family transporter [Solidesulfovibrio fructosivorans]EFL52134.1 protein of unknown function DUF6 transmembrane [Solidesulfovibrio fructosivorans JJ]]